MPLANCIQRLTELTDALVEAMAREAWSDCAALLSERQMVLAELPSRDDASWQSPAGATSRAILVELLRRNTELQRQAEAELSRLGAELERCRPLKPGSAQVVPLCVNRKV